MVGTSEVERACDTAYARAFIFTPVENSPRVSGLILRRSHRKISSSEGTAVSN